MNTAAEAVTHKADWTLAARRARRLTVLWLAVLLAVSAVLELAACRSRRELPLVTAAVAIVVGAWVLNAAW